MRYAQVTPFEVCNGKEIGTSIFVQGCSLHCNNCFNVDTWDYNGGKEWNDAVKSRFFDVVSRFYIKRVSVLGGEPLVVENVEDVINLIKDVKSRFPDKKIWLFTGFKWENIMNPIVTDNFDPKRDLYLSMRKEAVSLCDVVVDGRYIDGLRDVTLAFRGSSNQRVIDVQKTLENGEVVLYSN